MIFDTSFCCKKSAKKGWLAQNTQKRGKNGKFTNDASPLEWEVDLKKSVFMQFDERRRGMISDESGLAYHTNWHNTLIVSLLYEIPTWCED